MAQGGVPVSQFKCRHCGSNDPDDLIQLNDGWLGVWCNDCNTKHSVVAEVFWNTLEESL
jgi:hypothetical protein